MLIAVFRQHAYMIKVLTISTGTVHTSAKTRLTWIGDPDRHQSSIVCSLAHCQLNLPSKFHANPFGSFCAKLLTDKQTDRQTDKQRRLHDLRGGGDKSTSLFVK